MLEAASTLEDVRSPAHRDAAGPEPASEEMAQTIPELGAELRGLRSELRAYVGRHDREHDRTERELGAVAADVAAHDDWMIKREAYEQLVRWLVGSNVGVLIGLLVTLLGLASGHFALS